MGGYQIPSQGPNDDGFDEEGYDESQRAEIIEVTQDAPSNGTILTDIPIDLGDDDVEAEDELNMVDGEIAGEDDDAELDEDDLDEDEIQDDLDDDDVDEDDLDDGDEVALQP
ncbi:DNA primase [Sphingomonas sp. M1-B02]|uniref:DNA primase n=1 Tax=Sphingomonas sp. M1-B02 TaxID=3114300 RepID=UPI00223EF72F|nr:DNA primase [Sphingomonas sp. S6-11]UZK65605.1 DNA primase [Sphingomonas sp. S6-11]